MRTILPLVAWTALGGCAAGNGDLWLVHVPVMTNYDCETEISENFSEANPPDAETGTVDWVYTEEARSSDGLMFAQIVDGRKKAAYLVLGDVVYPGLRDADGYTFAWESFENDEDAMEYVPSAYAYREEVSNRRVVTIRLAPNRDTGGLSGTYEVEDEVDESYAESDTWDAEVPVATGQINNVSTVWLVGQGITNEQEREDCDSDPCELSIVAACAGSVDLSAEWVGYADEGVYAAVEDAEQSAGL